MRKRQTTDRQNASRWRFRLRTLLVLIVLVGIWVQVIVVPEYRRTQIIDRFFDAGMIQAPRVTMFGGGRYPPPRSIPEPRWFGIRQRLASWSGVRTTPWHGSIGGMGVSLVDGDAIPRDLAAAFQLEDLQWLDVPSGRLDEEFLNELQNMEFVEFPNSERYAGQDGNDHEFFRDFDWWGDE